MDAVHFRNFLGPPGTSLCGAAISASAGTGTTLTPTEVTCERCLALLGRLRAANIAAPGPDKRKG